MKRVYFLNKISHSMKGLKTRSGMDDGDTINVEDNGHDRDQQRPRLHQKRKMGRRVEANKENLLVTERQLVGNCPSSHGKIQIEEGLLEVGLFLSRAKPADDTLTLQLHDSSP
jgi:hypothetical protein